MRLWARVGMGMVVVMNEWGGGWGHRKGGASFSARSASFFSQSQTSTGLASPEGMDKAVARIIAAYSY